MAKAPKIETPAYEDVVVDKAMVGSVAPDNPGTPVPDRPTTVGETAGYGDEGHVNPAINPAPAWVPKERPEPVPVVNDPGLLGSAPSLADLNAAARGSYGVPETDATSGITEESNVAEIKAAAEARLQRLAQDAKAAGDNARKRVNA